MNKTEISLNISLIHYYVVFLVSLLIALGICRLMRFCRLLHCHHVKLDMYGVPLGSKVCIFSGTKNNFSATENNISGTKNNFSGTKNNFSPTKINFSGTH